MPNTIQKKSMSQQVLDYILGCIDRGELKRGDKLPGEREFAESLGISRVPLREAISALAIMGIVEKRHGEGNFIAQSNMDVLGQILRTSAMLDHSLAEDLFETRGMVEGTSARLAARNATAEDIEAIREANKLMEEAVPAYIAGEKLLSEMLSLDDIFHLRVAAASHNRFYIQFVNIMHTAGTDMGLYEKAYGRHPEKYHESLKFHRSLTDAIAAGDERLAQDIMCNHINSIRVDTETAEKEETGEERENEG